MYVYICIMQVGISLFTSISSQRYPADREDAERANTLEYVYKTNNKIYLYIHMYTDIAHTPTVDTVYRYVKVHRYEYATE